MISISRSDYGFWGSDRFEGSTGIRNTRVDQSTGCDLWRLTGGVI